jgi:uncharacterized membrane protein
VANQPGSALGRLIGFSDGIFAVAITLLVLSIPVPDLGQHPTDANLQTDLINSVPNLFGFVLSFLVVGVFWLSHHRLFQIVHGSDRLTQWVNLLFLMTICFVPFPTGVLAHYAQLATAVIFYAASMAFAGFMLALLWWVAMIRLAPSRATRRTGRLFSLRAAGMSGAFLVSIPVALSRPDIAPYIWLAIPVMFEIIGRIYRADVGDELRTGL